MRRLLLVSIISLLALPAGARADTPIQLGPGALNRYFNGTSATHWVTTGVTSPGYGYEFGLGYLEPGGGPGMIALYSCLSGAEDHFLSGDPACEGRTSLGRIGFSYATPPANRDTVPIYRCIVGGRPDHFVSNDPGCEGQVTEGALGHALRRSEALLRFWVPATGTHSVTAGSPPAGATYEFGLGFLLPEGGPGRHAIHGCHAGGADYFLSLDPNCEGRTKLGVEGYAYDAPPTTEPTQAVYRCQWPGHDHFASSASDCEGQVTEGNLGYLRTYGEGLHVYSNPANGSYWVTSGSVTTGFHYERTLGFLQQSGGPNLQPLYGCRAPAGDYFLSLDSGCEGSALNGRYGFLYAAPPSGEDTVAVYRCQLPGGRRTASLDPACGGGVNEQRLGYIRTTEQGAAPPPSCSPSSARVQAGLGRATARTIRYGGTATLSGTALDPSGAPAGGATVLILEGTGWLGEVGRVTAGADGRFSFRLPAGVNRTFRAAFRASAGDVALACSNTVALRTRAGVTLKARPRALRFGRTVRFSGKLQGAQAGGKLVVLQAYENRRWRTFKTARTRASGTFSARYRFIRANVSRTVRFRALVRKQARLPYQAGTSKVAKVRIRAAN